MLVSCQTWLPFKWSILIEFLRGSVTLVTGARCGIGRAVAISLAAACARVVAKFLRGAVTEQTPAQALALALRIGLYGLKSSDSYFARNPV